MARHLKMRKPRATEIGRLMQWLEEPLETPQQRRAQAILLYNDGMNATEIATTVQVHVNTIYGDLRAFDQHGVYAINQGARRGACGQLTSEQRAAMCRLADQSPVEVGLPYGRWSLAKLRTYLIRQRIVRTISREHLRRILKKGVYVYGGCNAS